jgi:hypothetical protein
MALGFLEVVAAIQRVEPGVQEELCPVCVADQEAAACQAVAVLREHEIDAFAFQVCEGLDHAVRGHDGRVGDHQAFQLRGREDFVGEGFAGVHDQGCGGEVEEPMGVGVLCQRVAEGRHCCPRGRNVGHEVVVVCAGEEGIVAMALGVVAAVLFDVVRVRGAEGRV